MGILRFNYRSQMLGHYVDITIVYPTDRYSFYDPEREKKGIHEESSDFKQPKKPVYEPGMKFQTVYLIHGGGDDDTLTYRYTNAERYAQENNVMLVTPNITNSFGVDAMYGKKYQSFLAEELPVVVQSLFASSPAREDNFIVGYAMGANVALGTAILHPDKFAACVDISGGIGMTLATDTLVRELKSGHFMNFMPIYNSSFGPADELPGSPRDLYAVAKEKKASGETLSKFHIICGSEEFIRARVEDDVRILKELDYDVEYILAEGYDHNYEMWDKYINVALSELLPLKRG